MVIWNYRYDFCTTTFTEMLCNKNWTKASLNRIFVKLTIPLDFHLNWRPFKVYCIRRLSYSVLWSKIILFEMKTSFFKISRSLIASWKEKKIMMVLWLKSEDDSHANYAAEYDAENKFILGFCGLWRQQVWFYTSSHHLFIDYFNSSTWFLEFLKRN